ncbi:MAG: hypothetical protein NC489_08595 [Ruminococcus flavefaciens]|nr:hypothetical protein [Ruminococcus flavefaciens]
MIKNLFQLSLMIAMICIGSILPSMFQVTAFSVIEKRYDNPRYTKAMWALYEIMLAAIIVGLVIGIWAAISMLMKLWCGSFIMHFMANTSLKWFYGCSLMGAYLYMNLMGPIRVRMREDERVSEPVCILQWITLIIYMFIIVGFMVLYVRNWFIPTFS